MSYLLVDATANASIMRAMLSFHLNKCHPSLANNQEEHFAALSESVCASPSILYGSLIERNYASDSLRLRILRF